MSDFFKHCSANSVDCITCSYVDTLNFESSTARFFFVLFMNPGGVVIPNFKTNEYKLFLILYFSSHILSAGAPIGLDASSRLVLYRVHRCRTKNRVLHSANAEFLIRFLLSPAIPNNIS